MIRPPLQALLLAPDLYKKATAGEKSITIREGHRDYQAGPCLLVGDAGVFVENVLMKELRLVSMCDITGVLHTRLVGVAREEWEADGFQNRADMLAGLRRFYPNLTMDSDVTVIRWANVRELP